MRSHTSDLSDVADEIREYLENHPHASDTLDGVLKWWLPRQRLIESARLVEGALEKLVHEGVIEKHTVGNGITVYHLQRSDAGRR